MRGSGMKKRTLRSNQETDEGKRCAALANSLTKKAPYKGLGADSEEKHEPVSDIDTVLVDSLKALDPKRPIREADIGDARPPMPSAGNSAAIAHSLRAMVLAAPGRLFSNRPFGVKRFQTIRTLGVDVARGLVLLFGIGTKALVWGFLCQGVRQGGEAFLRRFLGSISKPVSSSRPAHR
jgi:hypothetical protein